MNEWQLMATYVEWQLSLSVLDIWGHLHPFKYVRLKPVFGKESRPVKGEIKSKKE